MQFRDLLIGAASSLAVTVLGGVAVYYATKEPDLRKVEKLVYTLTQPATFTGVTQELSFSSITLTNEGGVAAKNVAVAVSSKTAEIRDFAVDVKGGVRQPTPARERNGVILKFDTILPQETVAVNLLLSRAEPPTVVVRSDASLGSELKANELAKPNSGLLRGTARVALVTALGLTVWGLIAYLIFRRGLLDHFPSKNDTAFLLLHSGLLGEADQILGAAVRGGGSDQFTLSNYAFCKAAQGRLDEADQLLQAAKFRSRSHAHGRAVVMFNEALIALKKGDEAAALGMLRDAVGLSKSVKEYCEKTIHLDAVRAKPAFQAIL